MECISNLFRRGKERQYFPWYSPYYPQDYITIRLKIISYSNFGTIEYGHNYRILVFGAQI